MAANSTTHPEGWTAPGFSLPATDGRTYSYADIAGPKGTVVAFICNHCPYVKAVVDRFVADADALRAEGICTVAIMPNDWTTYPEDSPARMAAFAEAHGFSFPYLIDESQATARAYDAACTPEFFGFDADGRLAYHGRLDSARGTEAAGPDTRRELREAMLAVAAGGAASGRAEPALGCSIKWRR